METYEGLLPSRAIWYRTHLLVEKSTNCCVLVLPLLRFQFVDLQIYPNALMFSRRGSLCFLSP